MRHSVPKGKRSAIPRHGALAWRVSSLSGNSQNGSVQRYLQVTKPKRRVSRRLNVDTVRLNVTKGKDNGDLYHSALEY